MSKRPDSLNLSNWRLPPHGRWSFHHVSEVIPSEIISKGSTPAVLDLEMQDVLQARRFQGLEDADWNLQQWMDVSQTDALLVAHRGRLVHEWYVGAGLETHPHIVFSVSKSMTATLAGTLVDEGLLDPSRRLVEIIPALADSGFADASVQHLLDMQICIDFDEDYLATSGKFVEYRISTGWHPCGVDEIDQNLHQFLCSLNRAEGNHGEVWQYKSPNSDLLGWVLEAVSGERFANLMSKKIWQPMGAEADAYVTVDRKGAARSAGGICVVPRDLLRFGELVRNRGFANGQQIVPQCWIDDCCEGGSREAWEQGESAKEFPAGKYRNKWYQTGNPNRDMLAIGIHSQWIYIDPISEVTIIKLSSQDTPLKPELDAINLRAFENICASF